MFRFEEILNVELCQNNPEAIIVFGDNLIGKGKKGQAIIRDCSNSYGVPTKRLPSMKEGSFFSDLDSEYNLVRERLSNLWKEHKEGKEIIIPINKIGTGLADLQNKSPKTYKMIESFYKAVETEINKGENNEYKAN